MSNSLSHPQTNKLATKLLLCLFLKSFHFKWYNSKHTNKVLPFVPRSHSFSSLCVHYVDRPSVNRSNTVDVGTTYTATDTLSEPSSDVASQLSVCRDPARQQPNPFIISPLNFCSSINMLFQDAAVILKRSSPQRTLRVWKDNLAFWFLCKYLWAFWLFVAVSRLHVHNIWIHGC